MSRKTEPRCIVPHKKGNCLSCGGTGVTGMYQDRCSRCDGSGLSEQEVIDLVSKNSDTTKDVDNIRPKQEL